MLVFHIPAPVCFRLVWIHTCISRLVFFRNSHRRCSVKKGVLKNFSKSTGNHLYLRPANLLKKSLRRRCFPVKFSKISKNTFSDRTPLVAASFSCVPHSIDICTVGIKNITNMYAVSTSQIADIFYFNDYSFWVITLTYITENCLTKMRNFFLV